MTLKETHFLLFFKFSYHLNTLKQDIRVQVFKQEKKTKMLKMHFFFFFTQLRLLTCTPQYLICICLQTTLLLLEYKSVKVSYADANDAKISEDTPLTTFSLFLPCSLSPWSVWIWPHVKKEPWCCLLKALLTDQPLLHFKTNWSWCIYLGSDIFKLFLMHHSSANNIKQIWSICDAVSQALDLWRQESVHI